MTANWEGLRAGARAGRLPIAVVPTSPPLSMQVLDLRRSAGTELMQLPHPAIDRTRGILDLEPVPALAGIVGAIKTLRDDAFELHLAGRAE
jgi:hypothetical protein